MNRKGSILFPSGYIVEFYYVAGGTGTNATVFFTLEHALKQWEEKRKKATGKRQ